MFISELSLLTYKLTMGDLRTALSDNCLCSEERKILGCFTDSGHPSGFAIFSFSENDCLLFHLAAEDNSIDVVDVLIGAVIESCKDNNITAVYWNTSYARIPDGFIRRNSIKVYRIDRSSEPQWKEFAERIKPVIDRQIAHGYVLKSLEECAPEHVDEIIFSYKSYRESTYMEYLLQGVKGELLPKLSSVLLKDNHVAAYCIINAEKENQRDCTLGFLGCTRMTQNVGTMAPVLIKSAEAIAQSDFESVRFIVYESNFYSGNLMKNHLSFIKPRTVVHEYYCPLGEEENKTVET